MVDIERVWCGIAHWWRGVGEEGLVSVRRGARERLTALAVRGEDRRLWLRTVLLRGLWGPVAILVLKLHKVSASCVVYKGSKTDR